MNDHNDPYLRALRRAHQIVAILEILMATLKDVQDDVTAQQTVVQSAIALLNGLAAQVAALAPNQAAIDALAQSITDQTQTLATAVTANTPAAPGATGATGATAGP